MVFQHNLFVVCGFFLISCFILGSMIRHYNSLLKKTMITFTHVSDEESSDEESSDEFDDENDTDTEYDRKINKELFK